MRRSSIVSDPIGATPLTVNTAADNFDRASAERDAVTKYLADIGRRGGIKGGKARAANLSDERKQEIARKAAQARWNRGKP
jgi:uncharacterized membrane protein YdbT with pleckstrin-like domain